MPKEWQPLSDEEYAHCFERAEVSLERGWGLTQPENKSYLALARIYKIESKGALSAAEIWDSHILRLQSDSDNHLLLGASCKLLCQGDTLIGGQAAKYCFVFVRVGSFDFEQCTYFFTHNTVGYCIGFMAQVRHFHELRDMFLQIASSFTINDASKKK